MAPGRGRHRLRSPARRAGWRRPARPLNRHLARADRPGKSVRPPHRWWQLIRRHHSYGHRNEEHIADHRRSHPGCQQNRPEGVGAHGCADVAYRATDRVPGDRNGQPGRGQPGPVTHAAGLPGPAHPMPPLLRRQPRAQVKNSAPAPRLCLSVQAFRQVCIANCDHCSPYAGTPPHGAAALTCEQAVTRLSRSMTGNEQNMNSLSPHHRRPSRW